ncbi:MAG: hypothetical protein K9G03_01520 [Pontimonas sp.]|nr:hypothetical protein [Pontimonas sp.]
MSRSTVRAYVAESREDLGATLDEIEHRMRPDVIAKKLGAWVSRSWDEDSTPWLIAAGVTVIGVVAAVLWAVFDDD